ncbi:hypothetical protein [uncultured Algibacter sp.]|uniref:hypothetical protein n=1 Tax=uncultured Algibacter sp. TaxID=298659 RepID=UPI00261EA21A|nr:hypothetical protein [uncultured Algibacter sp.]
MKTIRLLKAIMLSTLILLIVIPSNKLQAHASSFNMTMSQPSSSEPSKHNASSLITSANKALTYTIKVSKESKDNRLSMNNKDAAPYWKALKSLNSELHKTERGALLKDETFFTGMAAALSSVEELKIVYEMINVKDEKIQKGINQTSETINLLYMNYSKESQDKDSNKPLTSEERKQLEKLKSKQKELQSKLNEMEKKMGKNAKGINELRKKSIELERAQNNRNDYFWAMHTFNMMHGWMWG